VLLVQPATGQGSSTAAYAAFADYLGTAIGRRCTIHMPPNYVVHWEALRRNNYDLALDASHYTDYRIQKFGFSVLARVPDTESYSLVVRDDRRLHDPTALAAKRIATLGLPSMAAARLHAMFPNPVRQPIVVEVKSAADGLAMLLAKQVDAAMLPTPAISRRVEQGGLSVVLTTEPITPLALSVSPRLTPALQDKIRLAILGAHETSTGRAMLQRIGFGRFEPANAEMFANQGNVLKGYWGY
jgi:ABC-type phosphate/phosphonate transport system substrate-binding protein